MMFDAAAVATVAEVAADVHASALPAPQDASAHEADGLAHALAAYEAVPGGNATTDETGEKAVDIHPAATQAETVVRTVVFIDTTVSDYETLIKDIAPDAKVVLLDPEQEALSQMTQALAGMSNLDSIQVVSHGGEGHLYIAGRVYWADGLANRAQDLQAIGAALKPGGDILFYACNVGAGEVGQEFAQTIHRLTGADVAVSNDQTGNATGQNWTLELQTGIIEATTPFAASSMEAFSGRLNTVTVTVASGTAAGSLNHAIVNAAAGDIIVFDPTLASGKVSLGVTTSYLTAAAQSFTINGDVNGDGVADIILSGDNGDQTTTSSDYRGILFNAAGKTLNVKGLIFEQFYSGTIAFQGALTLQSGSLVVENSIFRDNLNNAIATGSAASESLTIKNSIFSGNTGVVTGTAAYSVVRSTVRNTLTIENSIFVDNSYTMNTNSTNFAGGIISQWNSGSEFTVNIRNVTMANNSYVNNNAAALHMRTAGIGIYYDGATGTATASVYNTIIAGNSGNLGGTAYSDPNAIYYNSAKVSFSSGNNYQGEITGNATFVDSSNANLSLRDYRPASTATSFINAGDSSNASYYGGSYDIRGIDRIRDGALDLGAYEVHWNAGAPTVDLNGTGVGNDETVNSGTPASGVLIAPNADLAQTDTDTRLLGATITLSGIADTGNETLTLSTADVNTAKTYGIAVLANDGATITLNGAASVADYQSVIRMIQYKNSAGSFTAGARTATVTVHDGETTSTARTSTINLNTGSDTTPPTFDVAPSVGSATTDGFTPSASLDEAGTVYYVVVANNATAPTAAQVKAGQDSTGAVALKSGNSTANSGNFDSSFSAVTGLTAGTDYDVYFVAEDSAGNLMVTPVKVDASTTAGGGNAAPVNSVVPSVTGTATVGNALSTGNGSWTDPDGDPLSYTYQWYRADDTSGTNATAITGATASNYTLTT
ncbi:DUF4347 domain-containing protein, partial [Niveispirillum fermenti]